jgi:hypothetical protein
MRGSIDARGAPDVDVLDKVAHDECAHRATRVLSRARAAAADAPCVRRRRAALRDGRPRIVA